MFLEIWPLNRRNAGGIGSIAPAGRAFSAQSEKAASVARQEGLTTQLPNREAFHRVLRLSLIGKPSTECSGCLGPGINGASERGPVPMPASFCPRRIPRVCGCCIPIGVEWRQKKTWETRPGVRSSQFHQSPRGNSFSTDLLVIAVEPLFSEERAPSSSGTPGRSESRFI